MDDERISTPPSWTETDYNSDRPDVRQAKQPAIFDHDSGDITVFVRPNDPGQTNTWRIELAAGSHTNFDTTTPLKEDIDDRATAIEYAQTVMDTIHTTGLPATPASLADTLSDT